ncbi:hypothetical protein [Flectobacillus sp. BAB-3569]|uniref:hypothetical protein n=1 Tax=Flectobacillus sp. BAB-3569 TaxID=1509483 RepID=UPI000BA327D8|nr:hypothetical protein [Flectobacillus sp. BAB-3569]PAC27013.1 hypothetical protein BWI92_24140 [Flectobacillus sp. BAB-3569]
MAAQAGTELFSIQLNGAICYESTDDFPNTLRPMQTFYGDKDGAAEPPKDKLFLSGERVGITLGETKSVGNKLYYHIKSTTENREKSGAFGLGWGKGVYNKVEAVVWVLSTDVTDDKQEADKLLNERLNPKQVAKDKATQKVLDTIDENDNSFAGTEGNSDNTQSLNITKLLAIVLGFIAIIIMGVLLFKSKNREQIQLAGKKHYGVLKTKWKQLFN